MITGFPSNYFRLWVEPLDFLLSYCFFDIDCLWTSLIRFDSRWLISNNVMLTCIYCKKIKMKMCE